MKEIQIKNKSTNMKIYINGKPNSALIPKDTIAIIAIALERDIIEMVTKNNKRKLYKKKE